MKEENRMDGALLKEQADVMNEMLADIGLNFEKEARPNGLDAFDIDYGSVLSFIGSGGKSSLILALARKLKAQGYRVLVTTTTHIKKPEGEAAKDLRCFTELGPLLLAAEMDPSAGIYVYGEDAGDKLSAFDPEEFERLEIAFDIFLIEADGSRGQAFKAWRAHEPAVFPLSTKTVLVLPEDLFETVYDEAQIFHPELFREQFGVQRLFDEEIYLNIMDTTQGPLKAGVGRLYVYLSRSDLVEASRRPKIREQLLAGARRRGYQELEVIDSDGLCLSEDAKQRVL